MIIGGIKNTNLIISDDLNIWSASVTLLGKDWNWFQNQGRYRHASSDVLTFGISFFDVLQHRHVEVLQMRLASFELEELEGVAKRGDEFASQ